MKFLFFDTETNGLPLDYKASYTDVDNWPRVIQLGWALTDDTGNILASRNDLIKPEGWMVPTEAFWIDNGFTQERNEREGIRIIDALNQMHAAKMQADVLVAHNLNFDHRIVWAEFIRNGLTPRSGMAKICTMMKSTSYCKIPAKRGYKWPRLEELHEILFACDFEGAHDAGSDVLATVKCFFELVRIGVIEMPVIEPIPE
jgi:DNA polymerase III epsilon subunit-like protein